MCRVEERVYIGADGSRQKFEDAFPCHKAHRGKLCSNVKRKTIEYFPKPPPIARDDASSPASINPPTPTGTGSYVVQQRRPSTAGRRPSTREGPRAIKPEIIIEFGSKKDRSTKYPPVSSRSYKRSSLGAGPIESNDVAIDSPGSDASFTVRTGFSEAPVPLNDPFHQPPSYTTRPAVPHSHHRHTSSASSYMTASQPPSLCATSDPESPSTRPARYPPTIVHNPPSGAASHFAPSSPTVTRAPTASAPSSSYRTTVVVPQESTPRDNIGPDGLFPFDYSDFVGHSGSSHASSGRAAAPEITDRAADRDRLRKLKADAEKKRQEDADHLLAQDIAQEEAKQVRFELGRADARAKERGENRLAESEKRRAEDREEARRRKKKEQDEQAAKAARKEKTLKADQLKEEITRKETHVRESEARNKRDSRPPTRDPTKRHSRRSSISQAEIQERNRLLAETEAQMAREREATEQREREERAAFLRQQQQTTQYWDPRGGDRYPMTNDGPGVGRHNSVSGRRGSVSSNAPPMGLGRTNSQRRVSVVQPAPPVNLPPLTTSFPQQQYSTRPPSSHHQNSLPPLFSPGSSQQTYSRPPSARHSSYIDNPFSPQSTRVSATSQENPFAQTTTVRQSPPMASRGPWDTRDVREALPRAAPTHTRQISDDRREQYHTLKRRGEDVLNRAAADDRSRSHDQARQATRNISKVVGLDGRHERSESENEEDKIAGYGPRLGLGKDRKRRN